MRSKNVHEAAYGPGRISVWNLGDSPSVSMVFAVQIPLAGLLHALLPSMCVLHTAVSKKAHLSYSVSVHAIFRL